MIADAHEIIAGSDNLLKKIGIGFVFLLLSFLILPFMFVLGYMMKTLRHVEEGGEQLPEWNNFTGLFVDGLKLTLTMIAFLVPIIAVAGISAHIGSGVELAGSFIILAYIALFQYIVPAIIRDLATLNRVNPIKTVKETMNIGYAKAAVWIFVAVVLAQVFMVLLMLTLIGIVLLPAVSFWMYLMVVIITALYFQQVKG